MADKELETIFWSDLQNNPLQTIMDSLFNIYDDDELQDIVSRIQDCVQDAQALAVRKLQELNE